MANIFKNIFLPKVGKNTFDLSHDVKMSFNMGDLVPNFLMDVLPGDSVNLSVEKMLRFQPLLAPIMHRVNVSAHFFFVPNRILWNNWEDFITGNADVVAPYINVTGAHGNGSLADYMGIPTDTVTGSYKANALPFAAYAKIYDEYYRDQNLQPEKFIEMTDGENASYATYAEGDPFKRAWNHDYFTSALPFAQKGDEVEIPLLSDQSVDVTLKAPNYNPHSISELDGDPAASSNQVVIDLNSKFSAGGEPFAIDPSGNWEVDLSNEAATINTLRRAFRLQEWLEKNARAGSRYIESIKAHFGVNSSDKRLNRPEYIGGSKGRMTISEVLTSVSGIGEEPNTIDPTGTMRGHGISVAGGNNFSYKAEEHGFIIGILNVQPLTAYQQGLPRLFSREDKLDYAFPTFANIGEQAILNKELYVDTENRDEIFGYIPRYSEYRYINNRVAGDFRDTLDFWHMGRIFGNLPTLNSAFIECDPTERSFAVANEDDHKILAHVFNNVKATRALPKFAVPTI